MRAIMYGIINKNTGKIVYKSLSLRECENKLNTMTDKSAHAIAHKWFNI